MLQDLNKGWLFVLMSSLATVLGCFIITLDVVYKKLFPSLFKAHPFDISNNSNFLIASLSLSSGCLIFTALYRLLPESSEYLLKVEGLKGNDQKLSAVLLGNFLLGMMICAGINSLIHFIASESIVHCVHEGDSHHHHEDEDDDHSHHDNHDIQERTPLKRGVSLSTLSHKISSNVIGKCRGFDSLDSCKDLNDAVNDTLQNPTALNYSEHPQSENAMFFDTENHRLVRNLSENSNHQIHVDSPLIPHDQRGHEMHRGHGSVASRKPDPEDGDDHHHHITTPLSRLLSIGVQTIVAICAHKFPEGFIMYSTSQANPELGLSICLSMLIHNFVEGFTMALPIYISLNSRFKAIALAGLMGGSAQPLGALLGSIVFSHRDNAGTGSNENFLFGCLISITAGFLSIIGFQMFASAMGFGGRQNMVLIWMFVGIALISLSYVLLGE